jgi:hypothetical protein
MDDIDRDDEDDRSRAILRRMSRDAQRAGGRFRRVEAAEGLRTIAEALKKRLPLKRAVVGGVTLEFGPPDQAPGSGVEIATPEQLRRLM